MPISDTEHQVQVESIRYQKNVKNSLSQSKEWLKAQIFVLSLMEKTIKTCTRSVWETTWDWILRENTFNSSPQSTLTIKTYSNY